jgi:hypothetical protein
LAGPLTVVARNVEEPPSGDFLWTQDEKSDERIRTTLAELCVHDIIRQRAESRYPNEVEYAFKHLAVRKLLLEHIDADKKALIHGLTAQWHELNRSRGIPSLTPSLPTIDRLASHPGGSRTPRATGARQTQRDALATHQRALVCWKNHLLLKSYASRRQPTIKSDYGRPSLPQRDVVRLALASASKWRGPNKLGRALRALGRPNEASEHFNRLRPFRRANDRVGIASTQDIGKALTRSLRRRFSKQASSFAVKSAISAAAVAESPGTTLPPGGSASVPARGIELAGEAISAAWPYLNNLGVIVAER